MSDDLDLQKVTILNSPEIYSWPATTTITRLDLTPDGVHIEFTKKDGPDRWPDILITPPDQTLQYTLWIVLNIASSWWAAGCIEYWFGLDKNGGPVDQYADHWYYDPNRWTPMTGHQPAAGERVGFLVTSGDARHRDAGVGLHERSNIVVVPFPTAAGASFTWPAGVPTPGPVPPAPGPVPPAPIPPPQPGPPPDPTKDLVARIAALEHDRDRFKRDLAAAAEVWIELGTAFEQIAHTFDKLITP